MNKNVRRMVNIALLIALQIVLSRFLSINTPFIRIGFSFIPLAAIGMLYGPLWGAAGAVIADLIGATLFPSGPFFPGFTLTAFLTGLTYGIFLHRKEVKLVHIIAAVVIIQVLYHMGLNSLWVYMMTGKAAVAIQATRMINALVMIPVQVITIMLMEKKVFRIPTLRKERQAFQ